MEITERTVVITGASSGLGASCARAFVAAGYAVALAARRLDRLERLAADIARDGGRALAVAADVTEPTAMRELASRALAAFGRIDVLVCSAGLGYQGSLDETDPSVLARLLDVNVLGTFNAVRAIAPYFHAQRDGHVIVISSIVGRRGIPGYTAYSAAKFAQTGMAEALRAELSPAGIAVSTVFPVSAATEFRQAMKHEFGIHVEGGGPRTSPDVVARAIVQAARSRRAEVYPSSRARWLVYLNTLAPTLADRVARRYARRRSTATGASAPGATGDS